MNEKKLAPIVLFVYNRPWHTERTINALKLNSLASDSDLFIFSDGPKNEENKNSVEEVRKYLKTINGFKSINIVERKENIGLGTSVILGVTEIVEKFGFVIVLEDDLIVSPFFLEYMNRALIMYKNYKEVGSINSFFYPVKGKLPESFFARIPDSCGWGTWSDRWLLLNHDPAYLYKEIKRRKMVRKFNIDGTYPFFQMLKGQIKGLNSSWAIRWYSSLFLADKVNLYYGKNLVKNIGWDGSGTHCGGVELFKSDFYVENIDNLKFIQPTETISVINLLKKYFSSPKMFVILKAIKTRNSLRILLIDLGIKKRKK